MGSIDLNCVKSCRQTMLGGKYIACHDLPNFADTQFPTFLVILGLGRCDEATPYAEKGTELDGYFPTIIVNKIRKPT